MHLNLYGMNKFHLYFFLQLPMLVKNRADLRAIVGDGPDPELLIYPRYRRLGMGLGHAVRIVMAINQKHLHIALFGTARWLSYLYPRPFLVIEGKTNSLAAALRFRRFPVAELSCCWDTLWTQILAKN